MFQCNAHVEMNKFLCSLACTWMAIIDSQLYIIDSLSLDVSSEWNANLVVAWLYTPDSPKKGLPAQAMFDKDINLFFQ